MDIKHDWKALNEVLFDYNILTNKVSTVVVLEQNGKVIDGVVSTGSKFSSVEDDIDTNSKQSMDALAATNQVDQAVLLSKLELDQWIIESSGLGSNYFQQLQSLKEHVQGQFRKGLSKIKPSKSLVVSRKHFLLEFFSGWISKVLPRRFNVLLYVDLRPSALMNVGAGAPEYRSIVLSYDRGRLDQFFEPDFSSLHEERLQNWKAESGAIGQYLENRYLMPCFAVFMPRDEWMKCTASAESGKNPWVEFVRYFDAGVAEVYPSGWVSGVLMAWVRISSFFIRVLNKIKEKRVSKV